MEGFPPKNRSLRSRLNSNYNYPMQSSPQRKRISTGTGCVVMLLLFTVVVGIIAAINAYWNHEFAELHRAVRSGDLARVEELIAHGSDVNEQTKFKNWTPLHMAAMAGQPQIAEFLLKHGAAVNARDVEGFTPLHNCASSSMKGHPSKMTEKARNEVAAILIAHGADVNAESKYGRETPLLRAVPTMNVELARMLLEHGANPNLTQSQGCTALHLASAAGADRSEMVKVLLAHGADPTIAEEHGQTPLDWAKEFQPQVAELMKAAAATRPAR
jgi:ankyrin repeat protein